MSRMARASADASAVGTRVPASPSSNAAREPPLAVRNHRSIQLHGFEQGERKRFGADGWMHHDIDCLHQQTDIGALPEEFDPVDELQPFSKHVQRRRVVAFTEQARTGENALDTRQTGQRAKNDVLAFPRRKPAKTPTTGPDGSCSACRSSLRLLGSRVTFTAIWYNVAQVRIAACSDERIRDRLRRSNNRMAIPIGKCDLQPALRIAEMFRCDDVVEMPDQRLTRDCCRQRTEHEGFLRLA